MTFFFARRKLALGLALGLLLMAGDDLVRPALGFDRPGPTGGEGRSAVIAQHGMVCTSQPLATQAGLDVLKRGGNAVDAAIAANAVLGVVEPMSCGIGGDLFCIYWDAKTQKLYGLNASGRAPQNISIEKMRAAGHQYIPTNRPASWSVPGCVRGWEDLRAKFGTRPLAELLRPAIDYADEGFAVSPVIGNDWHSAATSLAATPEAAETFLIEKNGKRRAPNVGEIMKNRRLARTYKRLAERGADEFYSGEMAKQIVAYSERVGGYFSLRDFVEHQSEWIEPVGTNYRGYDVWELPPPGQGIAALQDLGPADAERVGKVRSPQLRSRQSGVAPSLRRSEEAGLCRSGSLLRRSADGRRPDGAAHQQGVRRRTP